MTWWQRLSWLLLLAVALALPTSAQMTVTIEGVPGGGPGITDGDKGDISVTASGTVWTIDPGTVTYAKLQPATAASRLLGRSSTGAGDWQEVTLGTNLSMSGTTLNATGGGPGGPSAFDQITSGTNTTATMVVGSGAALVPSGTGSIVASAVADNSVTFAKLPDVPTGTLLGRDDPGTGDPEVLSATQAKTLLGLDQVTNRSDADMFVLAKKLENTRLKKRLLNQENISPITIDTTTTDVVKIAELSQDTTFNPPIGTPDPEDSLIIEICTTARRTLTFSTATNGFSVGFGLTLPTTNDPGSCNEHLFKWKANNKWNFVSSTQTTTRGVAAQVWTSGGPLAEPGWAAPTGGAGTVGERFLPVTAVGFPASGAARVEFSGNSHKLLFDNTTQWCAFWGPFSMNPDYVSTPVFKLTYSMTSVTTSSVTITVRVMAITPGTDADDPDNDANYGTVNTCTDALVPSPAGVPETISCPLTNHDGLAARDLTKIELCRTIGGAAGMMEALSASLEYAR